MHEYQAGCHAYGQKIDEFIGIHYSMLSYLPHFPQTFNFLKALVDTCVCHHHMISSTKQLSWMHITNILCI